jgi:hypothetical protein
VQPEGEPQVAASVLGYMTGHPLLHLQRSIGNRAVNRLLQPKAKSGEPDAVRERETNYSALRVARAPHLSVISGAKVQREERPKESVGLLDSSVSNAIGSMVLGETEWKFIREGLRGIVEEVRHQPPERFQLIQTRFAQLSQSPTAQWEYYKGLLSGIGEGLWDSVKGIFDLLTLGPRWRTLSCLRPQRLAREAFAPPRQPLRNSNLLRSLRRLRGSRLGLSLSHSIRGRRKDPVESLTLNRCSENRRRLRLCKRLGPQARAWPGCLVITSSRRSTEVSLRVAALKT